MSNFDSNNLTLAPDPDIAAHMSQSFQLMIKIQQEAEAEFNTIVADIEAGKITLETVKRSRGLIS